MVGGITGSRHASTAQIIAIGKRLEVACRKTTDGFAEYLNGDSDEKIARDMGCSKSSVSRIRLDMVGKIKAERIASARTKEFEELKALTLSMAQTVQELVLKHNNLCGELALNQVLRTAKHHEVKPPPRSMA